MIVEDPETDSLEEVGSITPQAADESDSSQEVVVPTTPEGIQRANLEELIATDPQTVELVDGEVKLIEFFAFW